MRIVAQDVTFEHRVRLIGNKVEDVSEQVLVKRSAHGDERAFAVLVERYKSMVFSTAYKVLKDLSQSEDAAQDTFIKAYAALPGFKGQAKFSSWLYRICYNTCISILRKRRPEVELTEAMAQTIDGPAEEFRSRDIQTVIQQEVNRMPDDYRVVITLYHFDGMSYDEIAHLTHRPLGTVKAKIYRARVLLRERLLERVGWEELKEVMWK
ncbi:hypothetical protein CH330_07110 [candidate division WOR-3 bacterium JGI_Cruoil_03_51_56]|uniref:RNA polymerase subunit sigma-24 n=1 Tax=candidate division WOR-3 bacterium JGI_Cruoil_03_51_56 TaxID=1973747 RepID=A0A235BT99_UNCW3|nr:MAG: hypothetical protein CH330_07110 [candidate division WOR-3 bacterium JGI_Cruoil_03_51_56]